MNGPAEDVLYGVDPITGRAANRCMGPVTVSLCAQPVRTFDGVYTREKYEQTVFYRGRV